MTDDEVQEHIDSLIAHDRQLWLIGAGASLASNLPLMIGLTFKVRSEAETWSKLQLADGTEISSATFLDGIFSIIGESSTVERVLDQIGDYLALARRSINQAALTPIGLVAVAELERLRVEVLGAIRTTIRTGYVFDHDPAKCIVGEPSRPIVKIEHHLGFVDALFGEVFAGRRQVARTEIFTTNYDTLIEDALALRGIEFADAFSGGAVAFWKPNSYEQCSPSTRVFLTKLHGSIDWTTVDDRKKIVRRRHDECYPYDTSELLIYPQSTKYDFARQEPYATLFQRFRSALSRPQAQVLTICGYGFGDAHIDAEIEAGMCRASSELTLLIAAGEVNFRLESWLNSDFGDRILILTPRGVRRGMGPLLCPPPDGKQHDWWTFTGLTKRLLSAKHGRGA